MLFPPTTPPPVASPTPAALPDAPAPPPMNVPQLTDPDVQQAAAEARKRAAFSGYAQTLTTSGFGVLTPANTTAGQKQFLGM